MQSYEKLIHKAQAKDRDIFTLHVDIINHNGFINVIQFRMRHLDVATQYLPFATKHATEIVITPRHFNRLDLSEIKLWISNYIP